jgi:hypothetical protein
VAADTVTVETDGTVGFEGTGTVLDVSGVGDSGEVSVGRYAGEPAGTGGIGKENVSDQRLAITAESSLDFDSSRVRLAVGTLAGIDDPTNVTIYKRPEVGTGTFDSLETTVGTAGTPNDISDDTLYATTDSFSEFALASDTEPLPVEMAGFDATVDGDRVRLSWTTASETGNAGFRVQRRVSDGENGGEGEWAQVGRVDGSGTTTEARSYRFTDADLPYEADALTYRLKQVDTDGSSALSDPVTVERSVDEVELLGTYPNPAQSRATVRYALPEKQEVTLRLYDMLGRQVQTVLNEEQAGRHQRTLDVGSLPSGVYFLRLQSDGQTRTQKLTVVQ